MNDLTVTCKVADCTHTSNRSESNSTLALAIPDRTIPVSVEQLLTIHSQPERIDDYRYCPTHTGRVIAETTTKPKFGDIAIICPKRKVGQLRDRPNIPQIPFTPGDSLALRTEGQPDTVAVQDDFKERHKNNSVYALTALVKGNGNVTEAEKRLSDPDLRKRLRVGEVTEVWQ